MWAHLRYFGRLALRLRTPAASRRSDPQALRRRAALLAGAGVAVFLLWGAGPAGAARDGADAVALMQQRVAAAQGALVSIERFYQREVAPLEQVLRAYTGDATLGRRVATALVREGRTTGVEPRLLLAVLLVENPWLDPVIRSPVGAVGLMQVMPFHEGNWAPCAPDLEDVEANICHGARIFAAYLKQSGGDVDRALLRYNGCVNGTNTPDCHLYPSLVYARAGRASLLSWRRSFGGAATP